MQEAIAYTQQKTCMFLLIYIVRNPGNMYKSEFQGGWYIALEKAEFINTGTLS